MGRSLGYMVVPFLGGEVQHTWGIWWGIEHKSSVFLTHLWQLRLYLAFTDLVKNQSTGGGLGYSRYPGLDF